MNRQDIATLAFRILGIYMLMQHLYLILGVFGTVVDLFSLPVDLSNFIYAIVTLAYFAVGPIVALVCIFKSRQLALWTFPEEGQEVANELTANGAQELAFAVVGIWLAFGGLASFTRGIANILAYSRMYPDSGDAFRTASGLTQHLAGPIVEIALGAFLFFRYKDVIAFWQRWRRTGSMD